MMIYFNFSLQNPWHNENKSPWRDVYQNGWAVTKNKTLEIGIFRYTCNLIEFELGTCFTGKSHAGPVIDVGIFGWQFRIALLDNRHWNYDANRWVDYNNPEEVKKWW